MPEGRFKSRTFRRIYRRTPSSTSVLRYERRKPAKAHCAACGAVLKGVPCDIPSKIHKLSKTERRPERPYGGELCSRCMRRKITDSIFTK